MKGYGGVISFYVNGDYQHTRRFLKSLKVLQNKHNITCSSKLILHNAYC